MSFKDFTDAGSGPGSGNSGGGPSFPNLPIPATMMANQASDAQDYLVNYNEKFKCADPTLFRDEVISQVLSVLIGKNKPNALLVGAAGTGKTRIVEDIARRIATSDATIPPKLSKSTIYELPLSAIVAGSGIVGEIEQKITDVVDYLADPANDAILFVDEIHLLGTHHGPYATIAQILKPALARGDVRCIGATTLQEASDLADDPALNRRFSRVIVDELTREQTEQILVSAWPSLSSHYDNRIDIDDDAIHMVCAVADQYATAGSHRPDSALTLLDRVCGDAVVDRSNRLAQASDPTIAQVLRNSPITVTETRVKDCAMRIATGQSRQATVDFDALDEAFSHLMGQDQAIAEVRRLIRTTEMSLFPRTRPVTVLCAGPSGVGKSEMARIVSRQMCGGEPIMLNMTEYNSPAAVNRIIGSPAGYVGSDSHSELPFDCLESNPYQVILLDEMEKADRSVQRLFMGAFDDGFIKTSKGKVVDFSKCIVFVTTNASHSAGKHSSAGFTAKSHGSLADSVSDLSAWFDVEFLNRFQTILTFAAISRETFTRIVADVYDRESARINADNPRINLPEHLTDEQIEQICDESYIPDFGARPVSKAVRKTIEDMVCP